MNAALSKTTSSVQMPKKKREKHDMNASLSKTTSSIQMPVKKKEKPNNQTDNMTSALSITPSTDQSKKKERQHHDLESSNESPTKDQSTTPRTEQLSKRKVRQLRSPESMISKTTSAAQFNKRKDKKNPDITNYKENNNPKQLIKALSVVDTFTHV